MLKGPIAVLIAAAAFGLANIATIRPLSDLQCLARTIRANDVFLVVGQSNAAGRGDARQSPVPVAGTVLQYYRRTISNAVDPVGNAITGSPWPSFGISYYKATGRSVVFVPAAKDGAGVIEASDLGYGSFGPTGALFDASLDALDGAIGALRECGHAPSFLGILWIQGESDVTAIWHTGEPGRTAETTEQYKAGFLDLIARYRAHLGAATPFYFPETVQQSAYPAYWGVREAQEQVAVESPNTHRIFDPLSFAARSLMREGVHYLQDGYNELGTIGALNVVAAQATGAVPLPGCTLTTDKRAIGLADTLAYSWTSTDADYVTGFGTTRWPTNGSLPGVSASSTGPYARTITAHGKGGQASCSTAVDVSDLPGYAPVQITDLDGNWIPAGGSFARTTTGRWGFREDSSTGAHELGQLVWLPAGYNLGDVITFSVTLKTVGLRTKVGALMFDPSADGKRGYASAECDSVTGSALARGASVGAVDSSASSVLFDDGWQHCSVRARLKSSSAGSVRLVLRLLDAAGSGTYKGAEGLVLLLRETAVSVSH
jgi:hypothetical protein